MTRRGFIFTSGLTGMGIGLGLRCRPTLGAMADAATPATKPNEGIVVGLDIGQSKVCAIVAKLRPDGAVIIEGIGTAASRGVRRGKIVDPEWAGNSITEALVNAEVMSDVMIKSVYLAITGAHISSFNSHGSALIPGNQERITEYDCNNVRRDAHTRPIPRQDMFLYTIPQNFYVDGQKSALKPLGMTGRRLEADFHIIHGPGTQIRNVVRCAKEIPVEVEDVVFSPLAAAKAVFDANQRKLGALVIDMGGGTTDYLVYADGAVCESGCVAIGGDDISYDLSSRLGIPPWSAEKLKIGEGNVTPGTTVRGALKWNDGVAITEVERETLNSVVRTWMREAFQAVKGRLEMGGVELSLLGAGVQLTGGCSLTRGIAKLAGEVFGIPAHLSRVNGISGPAGILEDPRYSCAIGLVKPNLGESCGIQPPSARR